MKQAIARVFMANYLGILTNLSSAQHRRNQGRVVPSSQGQKIDWNLSLDPTCHSTDAGSVGFIDPPKLGRVTVQQGQEYPSFLAWNPRSRCNTRKVPATQLIDTTDPGTVGDDTFTVEYVSPLGSPMRERFHVVVR